MKHKLPPPQLYIFICILFFSSLLKAENIEDSLHKKFINQSNNKLRKFKDLNKLLTDVKYEQRNLDPEFTTVFIQQHYKADTGTIAICAKAKQTLEEIAQSNHYIDLITPDNLIDLPVGLKKKFGNSEVLIGISKAKFMQGYSELTIFCKIILPQIDNLTKKHKEIYFGADNIKLSHGGGLIGNATLVLLGDVPIPFNGGNLMLTLKGGLNMKVSDVQYQTYAKLECGGIKEIGLAADVLFPKNMLVPLKMDYTVNMADNARVKGSFNTIVTDWNDILAEFSIPEPFAIKGLENFALKVNKAVFDFSDEKNSPDVLFPAGYENLVPGNEQLWRGVYVKNLQVILPGEFNKKGKSERVSFEAKDMLVDNLGLTGKFEANNILSSGNASGWEFSVAKFSLDIKANHLKRAAFEGYIALPLTSREQVDTLSKTAFGYKAIINPGNLYLMQVSTLDNLQFQVWQASAQIDATSYIELQVRDGQFRPKAVLSGSLSINVLKQNDSEIMPTNKQAIAAIKGIRFQELTLQTEAPYIKANYLGYSDTARIGNFPISIYDISLKTNTLQTYLTVGVKVNLMKGRISGDTRLTFVGNMVQKEGVLHYAYKRLDIESIAVHADFKGFSIDGGVTLFRNNPIMGNGFKGQLKLKVKAGSEITVDAIAMFGSKALEEGQTEIFRYWYVDAMVSGLQFSTGYINITGLGGGASYHMSKQADLMVDTSLSPTRMGYVPNANNGLGLRAMVVFNVATSGLVKGEAGLEMMFTSSGGLANLGFYGKAYFMASDNLKKFFNNAVKVQDKLVGNLKTITEKIGIDSAAFKTKTTLGHFTNMAKDYYPIDTNMGNDAQISAFVGINYDFLNDVLHANLDLYVNVAGGLIRGRASGNRAGWAVMHFAPDEWYIHLGTPTDRLGLKMGIGSVSVESGGYFMVGTHIPGSPPPPPIVAEMLGVQANELDYMRDQNALSNGRGFTFGADFSINTGDINFLMFYASFQAGMGFDIMLKNYGDVHCVGSSAPIGMNGWYANGQSYAYLQGELGIQIKLMFITKRIPVIKAGAAVLLQAKLPNPSWFRGYVGGYFNVLGGLIKGKFRFKVTIGDVCEMSNSGPLDDIKVIADISPADKTSQVDVFASPQVVFNMPIEKPFNLDDEKGTKTYRIKLDDYTLTREGRSIGGILKWNDRNDAVTYESSEILPPNTIIKAKVSVTFEQKNGVNWAAVFDKGVKVTEKKEINFTTGTAPDYIPLTNIEYAYPVVDQKFLFTKEYSHAYIQLKRGQAYLLGTTVYQQQAQFDAVAQTSSISSFGYDSALRKLSLKFPELAVSQTYSFTLAGIVKKTTATSIIQQSKIITSDSNDIQITDNKSGGILTSDKPHIYLTYNFSTSRYNTFKEKIVAATMLRPLYEIILSDVGALQSEVNVGEAFDNIELLGNKYTGNEPLVQPVASLTDDWFIEDINPLIYGDYLAASNFIVDRDTSLMGIPPVKALNVMTWYSEMFTATPDNKFLKTRFPYRYYLGYYYKSDFNDLQYKVVNQYVKKPSSVSLHLQKFITRTFPVMRSGKYKVKFKYVLPGKIYSSEQESLFENPIQ